MRIQRLRLVYLARRKVVVSSTEYERYLKGYPDIMQAASGIIDFIYAHGSPQQFPRLCHWLGKDHGSGRLDLFQNCMVINLVSSRYFKPLPKSAAPQIAMHSTYLYECRTTGLQWLRINYEFRMLAFQERLQPFTEVDTSRFIGPPVEEEPAKQFGQYYATVGFEPRADSQMNLDEWESYLTEID